MNEHFKNWLCPSCRDVKDASVASHSRASTRPGSPLMSPHLRPPVSPELKPSIPLALETSSVTSDTSSLRADYIPPALSPGPVSPLIRKPLGTDLSHGGVLVGSLEYAAMVRSLQKQESKTVRTPYLDPNLVPIYSDTDSISSGDEVDAEQHVMPTSITGMRTRHIKATKLTAFLRSLLNVRDNQDSGELFVDEVVKQVMENRHASEMNVVCPVPLFLLRIMLQSAAQQPSLIPVNKVSVIDGKEVVRISDHPQLKVYFDRLAAGEAKDVIQADMKAEGLVTEMLDKNPNDMVLLEDYSVSFVRSDLASKQVKELQTPVASIPAQVKRSEHPQFRKYFLMLKRSIPEATVEKCMVKDGLDPKLLHQPDDLMDIPSESTVVPSVAVPVTEYAPEKPLAATDLEPSASAGTMIKRCEHPEFVKYFMMLKRGIPIQAVRHCMTKEGKDPDLIDKPDELIAAPAGFTVSTTTESRAEEEKKEEKKEEITSGKRVPLKEHPLYSKYFTMLKRGLPEVSVRHAMMKDGIDTSILDKDPEELIELESKSEQLSVPLPKPVPKIRKVPLCEHPDFEKYFTMLKRGLPRVQVERIMRKENKDTTILDHDPNELLEVKGSVGE